VPPVWPSLVTAADVEAVLVAPVQPEGDASSAGTPEMWAKSWCGRRGPPAAGPKSSSMA
jgi:hypothetical protein